MTIRPSESYWKAANGIRLSGMPAFKNKLTDTQLWQVSQLVTHSDEISESVKKALAIPFCTACRARRAPGKEPDKSALPTIRDNQLVAGWIIG